MKTTDHAFIKAFSGQDDSPSDTTAASEYNTQLWPDSYGQRMMVSRLPAETPLHMPESAADTAGVQDVGPQPLPVESQWQSLTDNRHIRIDYPDPSMSLAEPSAGVAPSQPHGPAVERPAVVARPHLSGLFATAPAAAPAAAANTAVTASPNARATANPPAGTGSERMVDQDVLLPQWEVDQLRWNEVANRLHRSSRERLSEIVKALMETARKSPNVVGLTSYHRGEGRTTVALALARLAGGVNAKVAIVDGDVEHPQLAEQVGIAFDKGWERLPAEEPLGEAALMAIQEQIVMVPIGQEPFSIAESTIRERARRVILRLKQEFDLILVDTGPMFTAAHRWFHADEELRFDTSLVVRDVRRSSPDQIDDVCCRLIESGIRHAAIIENFQEATS